MNEIIIDDKRYVSSKQAAEMTGYAKDYVGQLCREGRVPARLIGRSWYVLASAIQDHRFGNEEEQKSAATVDQKKSVTNAWEAPRYKAEQAAYFPSINKLALKPEPITVTETQKLQVSGAPGVDEAEVEPQKTIEKMQDAWKSWFSANQEEANSPQEERDGEEGSEERENDEEVHIPIHTMTRDERAEEDEDEQPVPLTKVQKPVYEDTRVLETEEPVVSVVPSLKRSLGVGGRVVQVVSWVAIIGTCLYGVLSVTSYGSLLVSGTVFEDYIGTYTVNN